MSYLHILELLSTAVGFASIVVLVWGVVLTIFKFLNNEFKPQNSDMASVQRQIIRAFLGTYILIALEILIAADIIETIASPNSLDIAYLAVTVIIRTFISYFLNKEIKEAQELAGIMVNKK